MIIEMREGTAELLEFLDQSVGGGSITARGVRINDITIPHWIIRRAPYEARKANAMTNNWRLDDSRGYTIALGLDESEARQHAEDLNTLVAAALMVMK